MVLQMSGLGFGWCRCRTDPVQNPERERFAFCKALNWNPEPFTIHVHYQQQGSRKGLIPHFYLFMFFYV